MCYVIKVKGTRPEMQVKNEESISVKNVFHTFGQKNWFQVEIRQG